MSGVRVAFQMSPDVRMTREIIEEALAERGIKVVAATDADVLIVHASSCGEGEILDLLTERPRLRVLAMAAQCDGGSLYELCLRRGHIGSVSPQALTERIVAIAVSAGSEAEPPIVEARA